MSAESSPVGALDSEHAARYCGISRVMLDREKRAGRICPKYVGTKPVYPVKELDRYLDSLPSEPKSA